MTRGWHVEGPARVAFVAGTLGRGGAERQLYYMLRELRSGGTEAMVSCLTAGEHWQATIEELGVPVRWFGQSAHPPRRVAELWRQLHDFRPDVVQSAHFHTNLYACTAARLVRAVEIGAVRNDPDWSIASLGRVGGRSLRLPRELAANSLAAVSRAEELGVPRSRLSYLPNVVDTDRFAPQSQGVREPNLLAVGRLVDQKRHDRLLRALDDLRGDVPDVQATIVGEGPLQGSLERLAGDLGVLDRLSILSNPPMEEVYARASVFILTSDFEGTPNVVLEAMAMGLPVVSFAVGGVPEIIEHGVTGFLVAPGDERRLTETVRALCESPELRRSVGQAARSYIAEHRSVESLARHLRSLYRRSGPQRPARPAA
jgi:glycosyltransferase involved in cell wall biosynthesis